MQVYSANSSAGFFTHFLASFKGIIKGHGLGWRLASRDIRAMYRQSVLGILWAIIVPLVNALTWLFLRSAGVVQVEGLDMPYTIYVFTGTMLWGVLTESVNMPLQKAVANRPLLTKINFPREAIIISSFYHLLFNTLIKVMLILIVMGAMSYSFLNSNLFLFPIGLFGIIITGTALGTLLIPIGLLYMDISRAIPIFFQFAMYLSPVVFVVSTVSWISSIVTWNPLTPLLENTRAWITGNSADHIFYFLIITGTACILFLLGLIIYRLTMPIIIERMSS